MLWAIYGYTMVYRETGEVRFLNFARKVADAYLSRLPEDLIPYWDFDAPDLSSGYCLCSSGLPFEWPWRLTHRSSWFLRCGCCPGSGSLLHRISGGASPTPGGGSPQASFCMVPRPSVRLFAGWEELCLLRHAGLHQI